MDNYRIVGYHLSAFALFMMRKSHKHSDNEQAVSNENDKNKDDKNDKNHSGHGCCH